jgi:uncharacterized protein YbjT (DUF2867 family)
MSQRIAVAGATGRAGRHVVDVLESRGHDAVPMSRSTGVDVVTGDGLDAALAGVESIIDVATPPTPDEQVATEFFTASARNLNAAGRRAGVRRIVVASIIGIDRFEGGYQAAKLVQERELLSGPIPVRVLRAAQFHEFVEELVGWATQGDVSRLPRMRTQLVSARTVAEALVELATADAPESPDGGPIWELAGPREEDLVEAAKLLVAKRGNGLRIEGVSDPSDPIAVLYESGANLPGPHARLAGPTFQEWLGS